MVFICGNILLKYKKFKIFQASKFSMHSMKARNPALFLQQKQKVTAVKVEKSQETN